MVSPQNPNPSVMTGMTTGRGFVPPAEEAMPAGAPSVVRHGSYVGWGGVIAGTLLTTALLIFLGTLGRAFGIPAYAGGEYGWGAGIWSLVISAIAFLCGGCLAAYMAPSSTRLLNVIHGAAVWALTITLMGLVFGTALGMFGAGTTINLGAGRTAEGLLVTTGNLQGAAWGAWLAMLIGLLGAAAGGGAVRGRREY